MDRIGCAFIARYELMLRARREPELLARPVAVADLAGPGRLGACSPAAEALGVRPGQLAVSARARVPELEVLAPDTELVAEGERDVLRALDRVAPRLDSDRRGAFFLGLGGLERLYESEIDIAVRVREALAAIGLPAQIAIADQAFTAWVTARRASPVRIVPPGRDAAILSAIPLADLPLDERGHEICSLLGLDDAAAVAALPPGELARRLGAEGAELERMLSGTRPVAWPREKMAPVDPERAGLEIDLPTEDLEPILFLGKSLIDRIVGQLAAQRRALVELAIRARLDDGEEVAHTIRPAEPTMEARPVVDLFRLWLEQRPMAAPVVALEMAAAVSAVPSARQLSLLAQREEKEAEALGNAVARLTAAFGAECAVRPVLMDTYRPEARLKWERFSVEIERHRTRGTGDGEQGTGHGWASMMMRLTAAEEIEWEGGLVRRAGGSARVLEVDGPHRASGEWWADAFDRSYYWLGLSDGTLVWVYRDERDGRAYLQGVAD
ncbi:MAG TPA: DNA polymerase Y family protein [Kofleriaceae bacterium]|nr:DNA polymerase Y family protein [Kofleriaceae bacterium]